MFLLLKKFFLISSHSIFNPSYRVTLSLSIMEVVISGLFSAPGKTVLTLKPDTHNNATQEFGAWLFFKLYRTSG